jgi:predicted ferric reductase
LARQHAERPLKLEVLVDGPYGCWPNFADDADVLVMVAGGIGYLSHFVFDFFLTPII